MKAALGEVLKAMQEGREARKDDKPRKSPYEGIKLLRAFHRPWLSGWDAMDEMMTRERGSDDPV